MSGLEILIVFLTFIGMEGVAWLAHRYLMHGFLWFLHEDHHVKTPGALEKNDTFFFDFCSTLLALHHARHDECKWLFSFRGIRDCHVRTSLCHCS